MQMMKYHKLFLCLSILLLSIQSCKEETPKETFQTIEINVPKNEAIEYYTKIVNFIDGASFERQAKHFQISELYLDSTDFTIFHRYFPVQDFTGKDSVLIRSNWRGDDSEYILRIDRVKIILNVN
jgi:hypothetical protein